MKTFEYPGKPGPVATGKPSSLFQPRARFRDGRKDSVSYGTVAENGCTKIWTSTLAPEAASSVQPTGRVVAPVAATIRPEALDVTRVPTVAMAAPARAGATAPGP